MGEQQNILILRYLNGELSKEELASFEASLLHDKDLQNAVQEYRQIVSVVKTKERQKLKGSIAAIGAGLAPNDLDDYKPKFPPPSNTSSWLDILKSLFFFTSVIIVAVIALIYFNQFPIEHPTVDKIREKLILLDKTTTIRTDTIYQTIENGKITTDTVIYGKEELIEFFDKLEDEVIEEVPQGNEYE